LEELFTVDNIMSALEYIDDKDLEGAQWYFHPTVWNVIRNLQGNVSDGSGGTIKSGLPLVNIDQNYKYNLLGYPVNRTSQAPKGGSPSNDVPAGFFGNMKNIIIGDRMSLAVQADSSERFSYDQTIFRATQRLAIDVAVPAGLVKFQMPTSS
jgi:HK97 family phage major capsid protein